MSYKQLHMQDGRFPLILSTRDTTVENKSIIGKKNGSGELSVHKWFWQI